MSCYINYIILLLYFIICNIIAHPVRLRPELVVLRHDLGVLNDPPQLVHHRLFNIIIVVITIVTILKIKTNRYKKKVQNLSRKCMQVADDRGEHLKVVALDTLTTPYKRCTALLH